MFLFFLFFLPLQCIAFLFFFSSFLFQEIKKEVLIEKSNKVDNVKLLEYFCDVCSFTIEVGEYRYDCRLCAKDTFHCCEVCYKEHIEEKKKPPKELHAHALFRVVC